MMLASSNAATLILSRWMQQLRDHLLHKGDGQQRKSQTGVQQSMIFSRTGSIVTPPIASPQLLLHSLE